MRTGTRRERAAVVAAAIVAALAAAAVASPSSEGTAPTTPSGWALTPTGRLITVANGPGLGGRGGWQITPPVIPFDDPGYPTNAANAPLSGLSAEQDFSVPDGADEQILNRAIWQSVRGRASAMPTPRSASEPDDR